MKLTMHRTAFAQRLASAKGWDTGVHPQYGVVLFLSGTIWQVVGGDVQHPSIKQMPELRPADVQWLVDRERAERAP